MRKWYHEDYRFRIEVVQVGNTNKANECRLGFEPGDVFECEYGTPAEFCPCTFMMLFPFLQVVRCGGDLRNIGAAGSQELTLTCPDGVVTFKVTCAQNSE